MEDKRVLLAHPVQLGDVPIVSLDQSPVFATVDENLREAALQTINALRMGCPSGQIVISYCGGKLNYEDVISQLKAFLSMAATTHNHESFKVVESGFDERRQFGVVTISYEKNTANS